MANGTTVPHPGRCGHGQGLHTPTYRLTNSLYQGMKLKPETSHRLDSNLNSLIPQLSPSSKQTEAFHTQLQSLTWVYHKLTHNSAEARNLLLSQRMTFLIAEKVAMFAGPCETHSQTRSKLTQNPDSFGQKNSCCSTYCAQSHPSKTK